MTGVCLAMPISSMDHRASMYPSQVPYMGNYISPSPSVYPTSYEASPPLSSSYSAMGAMNSRSSQDWAGQDPTLFSHSERVMAKERRREQNRASQRAYRKRKEDTVKGLYETIKDLRRDFDTVRAENNDLRSKLQKLDAENRRLRGRTSSLNPCLQCSEASVSCSKTNATCMRCEEAGLTCSFPPPDLTSRHPTVEESDHEDHVHDSVHAHTTATMTTKSSWYDTNSSLPLISESIQVDAVPTFSVPSYNVQEMQGQNHGIYNDEDEDEDDESLYESTQDGYTALLQPNPRQIYRSQSLQTLTTASDQLRPRSTSLYRTTET